MRLFVAEKPSLGRAIAAELGVTQNNPTFQICGSDTVTWCFGHILAPYDPQDYDDNLRTWRRRDLPIIPTEWKLRPKESALTQLQVINHLLSEAEMVVHAGDPDREGQLLVDEVLEHFHYTGPVQRIWLASLDSLSVQKALATLKDNRDYADLRDAARARSQADWLIGMNASRAMTIFGRETGHNDGVLSLGRVQTPTLALVVQRDREIKAFVPVDYLILQASLQNDAGRFSATFKPAETQPGLDPEGHLVDESIPPRLPCRSAPGSPSVFSSHSLAKDNTMKRFYLFLFLLLASLVFSSPVLAADSTSFDPTKVMVQSVGASLPVGTVITWPSNSWPSDRDNWMECKGKSISSAVYPELVTVVGSRVPDYRGIFLRGHGSQTSTHYGTVTHSSAALGQLQGDGIRTIWGTFVGGDWSGHDNQGGSSGAFWPAGNAGVQEGDDYNQIRYSFDVSRVTPVVGEVRPVNRAVRYLIRAR